ncbi:MAG TPA: hypothetical protein VM716_00425 [Gemmatimonadales bacterium]|nr:hypothetical protein [Gemmatimonadales bacterium]
MHARRRPLAVRGAWLLATALQLALPGAAAWADARVDAVEAHAVAHIESHTTTSCPRIHPPDCALCHFLSAPVVASAAGTLRLPVADRQLPQRADLARLPHPLARPHPQPRAPPALS